MKDGRWRAEPWINGKHVSNGIFNSEEAAWQACLEAKAAAGKAAGGKAAVGKATAGKVSVEEVMVKESGVVGGGSNVNSGCSKCRFSPKGCKKCVDQTVTSVDDSSVEGTPAKGSAGGHTHQPYGSASLDGLGEWSESESEIEGSSGGKRGRDRSGSFGMYGRLPDGRLPGQRTKKREWKGDAPWEEEDKRGQQETLLEDDENLAMPKAKLPQSKYSGVRWNRHANKWLGKWMHTKQPARCRSRDQAPPSSSSGH